MTKVNSKNLRKNDHSNLNLAPSFYNSENNFDTNFSTFHVFNHLLKRQCEDLIKLGVDPIISVNIT